MIDRLERDGLIAREAPHGDKRSTALLVTRKLDAMQAAILAHHEEMIATFSAAERDGLLELLQRLSRHLRMLLERTAPADK